MSSKLQLPNVTLVVVDTVCHELAALAARQCMEVCDFGAVHVHSNKVEPFDDLNRLFVPAPSFKSMQHVMRYLWREVPTYLYTSHALIIQWDSGIIDASAWTDEFLQYDYLGAIWGWYKDGMNVGNGGFSLRSAWLMKWLALCDPPINRPEDDVICRVLRKKLEDDGFKFATLELASRFSVERTRHRDVHQHFGYHGVFNWPKLLQPDDLDRRMQLVAKTPYLLNRDKIGELLAIAPHLQQYLPELAL